MIHYNMIYYTILYYAIPYSNIIIHGLGRKNKHETLKTDRNTNNNTNHNNTTNNIYIYINKMNTKIVNRKLTVRASHRAGTVHRTRACRGAHERLQLRITITVVIISIYVYTNIYVYIYIYDNDNYY